jgi:ATP-dependent DNA helicase RecG
LPIVLNGAFEVIASLLRKPARLRGTRFQEQPEYPEFAWHEAILNAVAHRDYGVQGSTIEVSLFDDHMEVSSPGGLVAEVRIEDLRERHRVHRSRNPRIVRALVDLGLMRDQGEGLPRVFAEMEGLFLPAPEIETSSYQFKMMLRNTPTLTREDERFLGLLGTEAFEAYEFRAMLQAFRSGRVDNASMRHITGLDTLRASRILRTLRDRDLLVLHSAGPNSYFSALVRQSLNSRQSKRELPAIARELPSIRRGTPVNPRGNSRQSGGELLGIAMATPGDMHLNSWGSMW